MSSIIQYSKWIFYPSALMCTILPGCLGTNLGTRKYYSKNLLPDTNFETLGINKENSNRYGIKPVGVKGDYSFGLQDISEINEHVFSTILFHTLQIFIQLTIG